MAEENGWVAVPPGTRVSTYENPNYQEAAPFAGIVLNSIQSADVTNPSPDPTPYTGVQYVDIPEFQAIGAQVGQQMSAALADQVSVDEAIKQSQETTQQFMKQAGYIE